MTIRDLMKYIESEYEIINTTPCDVCGTKGNYYANEMGFEIVNGLPFDVLNCVCEECGHEKKFEFSVPFEAEDSLNMFKETLN